MSCGRDVRTCAGGVVIGGILIFLIFFIQAEPYIGITPGCAASESGVTSPELLIMFPYDNLERF